MAIETILLFFITDLLFCLIPGPATMVTASHVFAGGFRNGWGPIAGINVGNFIWYAMCAMGLIALATTMPDLFTALRYAGTVYLVWMGISMIRAGAWVTSKPKAVSSGAIGFLKGFGSGLAVHMSNPKALLFYTAFLPQFIDSDHAIVPQILILAIITVFTETFGLLLYAVVAARTADIAVKSGNARYLSRISGIVLLLVATAMLVINR
ncbi:LysE family translocator [Sphingorhabdus sp. Alg239-R122]|uniref:LysE family translocator n=1 Tax=Sphingorhabdus sp. Alg239-R122 TaxID=2305989 RepID=UPI0013D96CEA|nr:LysE family translocator [Sphingorhabdus sp. Alg239-R122]